MANKIKKTLRVIGRLVVFAVQIVIGMVFFPVALVSAILLPKASAKAFKWKANFVTEPIITGYILVFSALPMKWWKKHMLDKVGGVRTYTVDWQCNYYFVTRTKSSAKSLSTGGCKAVLKADKLDARDVDNILERTDAKEIISCLPDLRQAKIYKIYSDDRLINMMSDEACHIAADLTGDYVDFVKAGMKLEPNEWYELMQKASKEDFDKCLLMQTPPENIVKMLLTNPDFSLEAFICIRRYGLSAKLIQSLDEKGLDLIKEPLKEFSQRTFLQRTHSEEEIQKFFREEEICASAQKVMNVEQYKVFHKTHYPLSEEAVEHFLAKEDLQMAELIFKNEEKLSQKAKAIIEASAALKDLSMR